MHPNAPGCTQTHPNVRAKVTGAKRTHRQGQGRVIGNGPTPPSPRLPILQPRESPRRGWQPERLSPPAQEVRTFVVTERINSAYAAGVTSEFRSFVCICERCVTRAASTEGTRTCDSTSTPSKHRKP